MIAEYLKDNLSLLDSVNSWEESIAAASEVLVNKKVISELYVQAMIDNVNKNGSYIVIVPQVALAHARPDNGVIKTGISLLKLNKPVMFPEGKSVNIVVVLAANEEKNHLELMSELADLFIDDKKIENIISAASVDYLQQLIEKSD
ncbi:PTS sugar transporter subunit IIA [Pectinatus haikarae]|uniref:Ascorbate-specific PTS system EIIA component n=1 Tax=Pectinatus haikarae TaxID=349096 RepID=A0ABT9Y7S4_9FIRM|nr:PTS sugar transporter subunit IIA [Pectinatus haikarae]MDQ0203885.1 PTS system mannitol-specific IIA component/PTS system ascorbate-specific IIA component [Pectinatus haikarae]